MPITLPAKLGSLAVALIALIVLPHLTTGYVVYLANLMLIYIILALGLNILIGETGQFGLAHVAFYGIGIYTTAILAGRFDVPFPVAIVAGMLLAGAIGFLLGAVSFRMRDIYLALSTFAFGEAMQWVFKSWDDVTNGPNGMRIPQASMFGFRITNDHDAYYIVLAVTIVVVLATVALMRSRLGRAFRAVRESEPAALALGVNVRLTKVIAFTLSAVYAGLAGGVYASFSSFIHPDSLGFTTTILVLTMIVVGGLGSIAGAIMGALILGLIQELLRQAPSYQEIIYGVILILFMMYAPKGVAGAIKARFGRSAAK
ncbi:branched-chain amino acid ABC transporter permease [uncultured Ferrovibrio sp.]|jgi:ABC-type branched-chain amino acid transport system, permease component|uniref:branched-chain amino acid ABC transporter permease n=1 Tax=uncultured Ferrovibrio sp. TaxID=1576913 RepID=UPI002615848D|nr:branched-chain amino acid ABC transporter permease [uncultured Ferrovibrio sp.]